MARKLASVVRIASCDPIPETDRLSVARMEGKEWQVVTGRDEFSPGDMAIYFEIDSFLRDDDKRYAFLHDRCLRKFVSKSGAVLHQGVRIKTVKLRKVISQGLLMPLNLFPEIEQRIVSSEVTGELLFCPDPEADGAEWVPAIGADLTELLHVEHYDEVEEALRPQMGVSVAADAMGRFPTDWIPKTDAERIQNLSGYFTDAKLKDMTFEVSEKLDGSSVTMFFSRKIDQENPFGVCSRNLRLKPQGEGGVVPLAWRMAEKYSMDTKIQAANVSSGTELAFQGELVGPGVNGNRDRRTEHEWFVFQIYDIVNRRYLTPSETRFICKTLEIPYVPVIEKYKPVFHDFADSASLLAYAEGKTASGHEREGLVFKSTSADGPRITFKAVSNRYLLKE